MTEEMIEDYADFSNGEQVPPVTEPQQQPTGVQWLPIARLVESQWNPRQHFPEAAMRELVERMKASGFNEWQPILVRPLPDAEGLDQFLPLFEIGAGHRRSRAAKEAGLELVPCIVREMTDAQFLDVLNFDNSAREDVHPLHEAAGWNAWMEKTGSGVKDIAAKIGQSVEYVYQRLKYSSLIDEAKAAFLNGDITAGHAILIARLQPAEQKKSLVFLKPPPNVPDLRKSVRELARFIQMNLHLEMQDAKFDLDDANLVPAAGTCAACPKRTKNAPDLIADREVASEQLVGEEMVVDDCTDPTCFQSKVQAHLVQIEKKLKAQGVQPVYVTDSFSKAPKGVMNRSEYQEVKQGTPGATVALVGSGPNAGETIHIKVNPPKPEGGTVTHPDNEAIKRQQEKAQQKIDLEVKVRRAMFDAIRANVKDVSRVDIEALLAFTLCQDDERLDALEGIYGDSFAGYPSQEELAKSLSKKMSNAEIFQIAVTLPLLDELQEWSPQRNEKPEALLAAAKRYKVDAAKIRLQVEGAAAKAKTPAAPNDAPPADKKAPVVPPPASSAKKKKAAPVAAAKKKAPAPVAKKKAAKKK